MRLKPPKNLNKSIITVRVNYMRFRLEFHGQIVDYVEVQHILCVTSFFNRNTTENAMS